MPDLIKVPSLLWDPNNPRAVVLHEDGKVSSLEARPTQFHRGDDGASILPPWPDAFLHRLMEALAPLEGMPLNAFYFARMLATAQLVVRDCIAQDILGHEAICFEAEPGPGEWRTIAIRDPSVSEWDIRMGPSPGGEARAGSTPRLSGQPPFLGKADV